MGNKRIDDGERVIFTKEMKKDYTLLFPMMAPTHFRMIQKVFAHYGYKAKLLETCGPDIAQTGLKYVHNDTCYPAILVIGQLIAALQSGEYDLNKVALMITQTGGGCRASNYIFLLRKALKKAGFMNIPVISVNLSGMERNPGFKITVPLIRRLIAVIIYGDLLLTLNNQIEPYEINKGDAVACTNKWSEELASMLIKGKGYSLKSIGNKLDEIAKDYAKIEIVKTPKVKVGIVGEIYVKYAALGNNSLEQFLKDEDCEINLPGMLNFFLFKIDNRIEDVGIYGGKWIKKKIATIFFNYVHKVQSRLIHAISTYTPYQAPAEYSVLKETVKGINGYGNKMGEGWLLTAEMLELCESGFSNIVCTQPFGCLPNHISGKGMIRKIRELEPKSNIVAVDYDAGAPRVNQENRIRLMLAIAKENLEATEKK